MRIQRIEGTGFDEHGERMNFIYLYVSGRGALSVGRYVDSTENKYDFIPEPQATDRFAGYVVKGTAKEIELDERVGRLLELGAQFHKVRKSFRELAGNLLDAME